MTIEVTSMTTVAIDGTSTNCVADAFANFKDRSAEIQDALMAFEAGLRGQIAGLQDDLKAATATIDQTKAESEAVVKKATDDAAALVASMQKDAATAIQKAIDDSNAAMEAFRQDGNAKIAAAEANAAKAIEDCNTSITNAQAKFDAATAINQKAVQDAQASEQAARAALSAAQGLQASHWDLSQKLMSQDAESAKAAVLQIQKLEVIGQRAALEEKAKALGI